MLNAHFFTVYCVFYIFYDIIYSGTIRELFGKEGDFMKKRTAAAIAAAGVLSAGCFSAGILSAGAVSLGVVSVGALSVGDFSVGALSIGKYAALGDNAKAMIAMGDTKAAGRLFSRVGELSGADVSLVKTLLDENVPAYLSWAAALFKLFI